MREQQPPTRSCLKALRVRKGKLEITVATPSFCGVAIDFAKHVHMRNVVCIPAARWQHRSIHSIKEKKKRSIIKTTTTNK
jgi:hypothetical protein